MKLRKFQAASMKEAVVMVKAAFGPDAMIVATRQLKTGVELTAAIDDDEPILMAPPAQPVRPQIQPKAQPKLQGHRDAFAEVAPASRNTAGLRNNAHREALTEVAPASRNTAGLRNNAHREALTEVASTSRITAAPERSRVALIGPTGVGKTTTIAKLAARSALIDGESTAIVSIDTYRVGGEAQLRIFADLIGVPMIVVRELGELPERMRALSSYDRVYLDTAGRSPRDKAGLNETVRALGEVPDLEIHLAIAAASSAATIDGWVNRLGPSTIDRLLFTKLDEADSLLELVQSPARLARPVSFITTGQRVPEDLEQATHSRLLTLALHGFEPIEIAA